MPQAANDSRLFYRAGTGRGRAVKGLALALVLAFTSLAATADVREDFPVRYYAVEVTRGQKVHEAVTAASPIKKSGRTFHGYTEWEIRWTWRHRSQADGRCGITSTDVSLTGSILLPRLAGGTQAQAAAFERYLVQLREHEDGHQRIARAAADDIERVLKTLLPAPSCRELASEANAKARAKLDEHLEREREYDRETRHGYTQGAVLRD
jgi:predicted secreted Zn-dependent protease